VFELRAKHYSEHHGKLGAGAGKDPYPLCQSMEEF